MGVYARAVSVIDLTAELIAIRISAETPIVRVGNCREESMLSASCRIDVRVQKLRVMGIV